MTSRARIRPAREDDLPVLRDIEQASGERYRDYGLDHVADDEPASIETLRRYAVDGRAWVAAGADDEPLGYLIVEVLPEHQGTGLGRELIDEAASWAAVLDGSGHIEQVSVGGGGRPRAGPGPAGGDEAGTLARLGT
ncbi:MAG TPA: GNAT family N-acetyltransferase [Acidimicrobiales bacterium]|nr:GNAT family N-acetyltransferase [Acidimicrobiales bacterium]